MNTSRKAIGSRLRKIRGPLTQQEFSDKLQISRGYVSDVERGRSYPSVPFLVSLAVNFGISLNWLLTGEEGSQQCDALILRGTDSAPNELTDVLHKLVSAYSQADPDTKSWLKVELLRITQELARLSSPDGTGNRQ